MGNIKEFYMILCGFHFDFYRIWDNGFLLFLLGDLLGLRSGFFGDIDIFLFDPVWTSFFLVPKDPVLTKLSKD
jgi:hypothetical protein